jgi:predicted RNase H-like nuclease (RuvC/YqgF family)
MGDIIMKITIDTSELEKTFTEGALEAFKERIGELEQKIKEIDTWAESLNRVETRAQKKYEELEKRIREVDVSHDKTIDRSCERLDALDRQLESHVRCVETHANRLDKLERIATDWQYIGNRVSELADTQEKFRIWARKNFEMKGREGA